MVTKPAAGGSSGSGSPSSSRDRRDHLVADLIGQIEEIPSYENRTEHVYRSPFWKWAKKWVPIGLIGLIVLIAPSVGMWYLIQREQVEARQVQQARLLNLLRSEVEENVAALTRQIDTLTAVEQAGQAGVLEEAPTIEATYPTYRWEAAVARLDLFDDEALYNALAGFYHELTLLEPEYKEYSAAVEAWKWATQELTSRNEIVEAAAADEAYLQAVRKLKEALVQRRTLGESLLTMLPPRTSSVTRSVFLAETRTAEKGSR